MHNEKLIRELYHGNIQPNAKMIVSGSEYQKAQFMFSETIDKLEKSLNEQEKVLLEQLTDSFNNIEGASDSPRYKALGNSVAIPCVVFVLRGIAYFLNKNIEMEKENDEI